MKMDIISIEWKIMFSDNLDSIIYIDHRFFLFFPIKSFPKVIFCVWSYLRSNQLFSFVSLIFFFSSFFLFALSLNEIFVNFCLRRNFCFLGPREKRKRDIFSIEAISRNASGKKETIVLCCDKICTSLSIVPPFSSEHSFLLRTCLCFFLLEEEYVCVCPLYAGCCSFLVNGIRRNSWIIR